LDFRAPIADQPNREVPNLSAHIHRELVMEDARFFDGQADRCWRLAWQCFHLTKAQKLNAMGNELAARARALRTLSAEGTSEDSCDLGASAYDKRETRRVAEWMDHPQPRH
jgi:hypothetical protein